MMKYHFHFHVGQFLKFGVHCPFVDDVSEGWFLILFHWCEIFSNKLPEKVYNSQLANLLCQSAK